MSEIEKIQAEIEFLVKKLQRFKPREVGEIVVRLGEITVRWDGYDWESDNTIGWYSSSQDC